MLPDVDDDGCSVGSGDDMQKGDGIDEHSICGSGDMDEDADSDGVAAAQVDGDGCLVGSGDDMQEGDGSDDHSICGSGDDMDEDAR